eukprot:3701805-Prymnesium_polylepis.1
MGRAPLGGWCARRRIVGALWVRGGCVVGALCVRCACVVRALWVRCGCARRRTASGRRGVRGGWGGSAPWRRCRRRGSTWRARSGRRSCRARG